MSPFQQRVQPSGGPFGAWLQVLPFARLAQAPELYPQTAPVNHPRAGLALPIAGLAGAPGIFRQLTLRVRHLWVELPVAGTRQPSGPFLLASESPVLAIPHLVRSARTGPRLGAF